MSNMRQDIDSVINIKTLISNTMSLTTCIISVWLFMEDEQDCVGKLKLMIFGGDCIHRHLYF